MTGNRIGIFAFAPTATNKFPKRGENGYLPGLLRADLLLLLSFLPYFHHATMT